MKKETIKTLKQKGWSPEDIKKAEEIIAARKEGDKSRTIGPSNKLLYWMVIVVIILGNFIISLGLIPVLLALNRLTADIVVVVVGFAFGLLFNLLVTDIEFISRKHHLMAVIIIPLIALVNLAVIASITNAVNDVLKVTLVRAEPISMGILYVLAFMAPYLWSVFVKKRF